MLQINAVVAPGLREEVACALVKRDETRLQSAIDRLKSDYARLLFVIARDELAVEVTADWSDAKIAELDELLVIRANLAKKHLWLVMGGSLAFLLFTMVGIDKFPSALLGVPLAAWGFIWSIETLALDLPLPSFLIARKKLHRLCGENYLPYDTVRQAASDK